MATFWNKKKEEENKFTTSELELSSINVEHVKFDNDLIKYISAILSEDALGQ